MARTVYNSVTIAFGAILLIVAAFLMKMVIVFNKRTLEDRIDTTVLLCRPRVSSKVHDTSLKRVDTVVEFNAPKRQADTSSEVILEFMRMMIVVLKGELKNDEGCMDSNDTFFSPLTERDDEFVLSKTAFKVAAVAESPDLENRAPSKLISRELGPSTEDGGKPHETLEQPLCCPLQIESPRLQYTSETSHLCGVKEISNVLLKTC